MAFWLPSSNKLYLPPTPVARVLNTEEYVTRTAIFYHASSERLLTIGHPYFSITDPNDKTKVLVPKVSGNQYRVFRIKLPDPNQFAIPDDKLYDPTKERLVFGLRGLQVDRGMPLGVGLSGHPLFNKLEDVENPNKYSTGQGTDNRQNMAFDVKQSQMLLVGCAPPIGEHWSVAKPCEALKKGDCPPLELKNTTIQDGDMGDIGFGAADFRQINDSKSDVPLDIEDAVCKYPDYLRMTKDTYGDMLFFYARREQMYVRHFLSRGGQEGEKPDSDLFLVAAAAQNQNNRGTAVYFGTPSGSLVSTDSQLFNRPYWVEKAQGQNNGILWQNELFVTVLDNTRGTNLTITQTSTDNAVNGYDSGNYKGYLRHTEEYEISLILQLCKVPLDPEVLAHINTMNPSILEGWNLGVNPPQSATLEDHYRYIQSLATRCPDQNPPPERPDPYKDLTFWTIDLTERLSLDLDQFGLGRRFLYQTGFTRVSRKRALATTSRSVKRKRK